MGIFKCHVGFQGCMVNNPLIKALLVIGNPFHGGPGWLAWLIMSTHSWIHMGMARFTSAEIGSGGMEWPAMSSGWLFWWIEGWQSKAMHGYGHMEIPFIAELHHHRRHLQHQPPKQHLSHLNAQTLLIAGPKLVYQTNQQYATIQTLKQKQAANT